MRPYVNDPDWPNWKQGGYGTRNESGTVPGSANDYTVELDQRIVPNGTLTVTADGVELTPVPWAVSPAAGQVAVSYDLPLLKFHSSRAGQALTVSYTAGGGVLSSARMQDATVIPPNVARLDTAQNWTALQTFNERPVVDDGLTLPEGGSPVLTADDPLNASALTYGTVPLARMHASVARRDVANTFAGVQTFNGGVSLRERGTSAGVNNIQAGDYFIVLNPSLGNLTVNLSDPVIPIRSPLWASVINRDATNTNTITFDAGPGGFIHGPGIYSQTWTLTGMQSNQQHRWFKIFKSTATTWLIDSGVFS